MKTKVPRAAAAARIDGHVSKYMDLLGVARRPRVQVRDDPSAPWLGRLEWRTERPETSTLEIQKRLLPDDRHLERVIAHEMIHHRDFLSLPEVEIARIRAGRVPDEPSRHTASFREGAAQINAIMGRGFVVPEENPDKLPARLLPRPKISLGTVAIALGGATILGALWWRSRTPQPPRDNPRGSYGR